MEAMLDEEEYECTSHRRGIRRQRQQRGEESKTIVSAVDMDELWVSVQKEVE